MLIHIGSQVFRFVIDDRMLHMHRWRNAVELEIIRIDETYSISQDGWNPYPYC
jgi:hypothetical protein